MSTINTDDEFLAEILLRLENSNITYLEARQSLSAYCKEREREGAQRLIVALLTDIKHSPDPLNQLESWLKAYRKELEKDT